MTLQELTELCAAGIAVEVEIHALTPMLYTACRVQGNQREPLRDGDRSLQFPSRFAAQQALAQTGLATATFIHVSAYDEMVGLDSAVGGNELREPVVLNPAADA